MKYCPILYVKIIPMAAWGNNFNFSIWYVELRGLGDLALVKGANALFQEHQRQAAWRLCLKFLKGEASVSAMAVQLEASAGLVPEAPLLRTLHELAVVHGDFPAAESLLRDTLSTQSGLFDEYIDEHIPYQCAWERLDSGDQQMPSRRGGHQMVWDPVAQRLYLLGGWDGNQDLADFWMWEESTRLWTCLSTDTRMENGPGPRSCHKVCISSTRRLLFVFGRFVEADSRTGIANGTRGDDLFQYDLEGHTWTQVSTDVAQQGGPSLVYDHQMVVDEERAMLYVFGGRIINGGSHSVSDDSAQYSGLYAWGLDDRRWRCIRADAIDQQPERSPVLRARIGHSMVLDGQRNQLIIFAGQRHKEYLADYYVYDIPSDSIVEMEKDTSRVGGPDPGFTQRATLDESLGELYLFTGLMRERPTASSAGSAVLVAAEALSGTAGGAPSKNSFWVYSLRRRTWTQLQEYAGEAAATCAWPCPRFAHQLAYDPASRTHYLFGGNPGEPGAPKRRLNDFWRLRLERPVGPEDILRRCAFLLRRQHYYELCLQRTASAQLEALRFLQNDVSAVVRHGDAEESDEFRALSGWLFQPSTAANSEAGREFLSPGMRSPILGLGSCLAEPADQVTLARQQLFEELTVLLPASMRPPTGSLLDLVSSQEN